MFKQLIILLIFFSFSFSSYAQAADRYSLGNQRKEKHHFHLGLKHLFRQDPQKKADKKKEKAENKERKQHAKDVKNYQKKANKGKEVSTRKPGYIAMRKNDRKAKRVNENKPEDPWIVRIFKHKK